MLLQLGSFLGPALNQLLNVAVPAALGVGTQFVSGLLTRELNRSQRNDSEDAFKAAIRAAANAVSPTVALGQTAVPAGGPATGSPFQPATLTPPSIVPANRIQQINPNFFPRVQTFQGTRRDSSLGFLPGESQLAQLLPVGIPGAFGRFPQGLGRGFGAGFPMASSFPVGPEDDVQRARRAELVGGGRRLNGNGRGDLLQLGAGMNHAAPAVTGLPSVGRFQKEANGITVQWYFWDGSGSPQPIDRSQANCFRKDCIFRLDVFRGKFVKMGSRRMNPMNVRAFFRAGRRVDAGERVCRKMFSEKRKQKTGTIRRKSRSRKK